jgi:hypothetical protein
MEQDKPAYSRKGARTIAKEFGIENQWRTVINRYNGTQGVQEAHEKHQKLTPAEEATLVDFLEESGARRFPQTLRNIEHYTNLIQCGNLGSSCEDLGQNWAAHFLDWHRDRICTTWSKPLDMQRACAMNPEAKKK